MDVHTIWEIKPFPDAIFTDCSKRKKAYVLWLSFFHARYQVLQQAICVFHDYPHRNVLHAMVGVGNYVRQLILERDLMPGNDFDWEGTSTTDPLLQQFITEESDIYRLLDPDAKSYNSTFKTQWLAILDLAIRDMDPNGDASDYAGIPTVPDLTKLANKFDNSKG